MEKKPGNPAPSIYFSVNQGIETYRSLYSKHRLADHAWCDRGAGLLTLTPRFITVPDPPPEQMLARIYQGQRRSTAR